MTDFEEQRDYIDEKFEEHMKGKDISCEKYWEREKEIFIDDLIKNKLIEDFEDEVYDFIENEYDYHDCMMNYISRGDMVSEDVVKEYNENYPN